MTELYIEDNQITSVGAVAIAQALKVNSASCGVLLTALVAGQQRTKVPIACREWNQ